MCSEFSQVLSVLQNADICRRYIVSHTVRQGQRAFMQTKQPLCEISQTKVNMFSRYRRVQQVYRENNVWDGGKEYSRVPEHTVSSSQRLVQIQRADGLRTSSNRLQTDLYSWKNVDFMFLVPSSCPLFGPKTGLCYISVSAWPEITSNTHWHLKD